MTDLIDTTEMYLRTILELEEENIVPLRARISERLGHSGPTVSQTIGRMERDGLVVVSEDRTLELTGAGRQKAVDVMRKHRLAERLLSDVIGLDWAYVHEEACRWEHVMSEQVERRLVELLGHPTESPYGNPIPGLDQLGDVPAQRLRAGRGGSGAPSQRGRRARSAAPCAASPSPRRSTPSCCSSSRAPASCPGASGDYRYSEGYVLVQMHGSDEGLELPVEVASHIFLVDEPLSPSAARGCRSADPRATSHSRSCQAS